MTYIKLPKYALTLNDIELMAITYLMKHVFVLLTRSIKQINGHSFYTNLTTNQTSYRGRVQ